MPFRTKAAAALAAIAATLAGVVFTGLPAYASPTEGHLQTTRNGTQTAWGMWFFKDDVNGAKGIKSFYIGDYYTNSTWEAGGHAWIQLVASDGHQLTYTEHDIPRGRDIGYYVGSWRLCDPAAGYCTPYQHLGI